MAISLKDLKLVWGRSGNRCAICRRELSEDEAAATEAFPLGEQAHIVAEEDGGPRGKSTLSLAERNRYHNLILLCPTDHTIIDKDEEGYPVEKLHMIKTDHELWVRTRLSGGEVDPDRLVAEQIYAELIDRAVSAADLNEWYNWTGWAISPEPEWRYERAQAIREFRRTVLGALWPGKHPELEAALRHFSSVLSEAAETFRLHYIRDGDVMRVDRFYRAAHSEELYHQRHDEFVKWLYRCQELIFEATKAANWFAESVRKFVNPAFFATAGRFLVAYESGFTITGCRLEYSEEQREALRKRYETA